MKRGSVSYILITVFAVVSIVLYLFLYRPLIRKLHANYDKCMLIENDLSNARFQAESVVAEPIERTVVFEDSVLSAVDELTNSAKLFKVNFISTTPDKICASNYPDFKVFPVKIILDGKFEDVAGFLGSLAGLRKSLVKAESFDMTKAENDPNKIKMILNVNLYVLGR
ncbi:hypothetical protein EPO66_00320 [bacterium]|nr:MAG: hypothetical protein EPO66_00320 [bacterium]